MFPIEDDAMLVQDREDLIALLRMRFGPVPPEVIETIYDVSDMDTLERLILVAANAAEWSVFVKELQEGEGSFRIVGEPFNPLAKIRNKEDKNGS